MISSPGLGSGLDINSLVSQLVSAETQPKAVRLSRQEAQTQAEISAIGSLKSSLSSFQSSVQTLNDFSTYQSRLATSSDVSILTATATQDAEAGSYDVEVTQLAQSQKLASNAFGSTDTVVGTGKLTIMFGRYDATTNGFALNPDATSMTVNIDSNSNTLQGIRDQINQAKGDVSASIINDGTGEKLVLSSAKSGEKNAIKVLVNDDDGNHLDGSGLSQLAYDPAGSTGAGKNLTQTIAAQDAVIKVDGLSVTRDDNSFSDVIQGVTLNLKKANVGQSVAVDVSLDKTSVQAKINTFIGSFNTMVDTINELSGYDPATGAAGVMQGDFTLRAIESSIREMVASDNSALSDGVSTLASIGITTDSSGRLGLDNSKLDQALDNHFDQIGLIFANGGSTTDGLISYSSSTANTKAGTYAINLTQLQLKQPAQAATQGFLTGNTQSTLVVDANNDDLTIRVDGVSSGGIRLTQQTYASGLALAQEIQNQINQDSNLIAAGKSVSVSFADDQFTIHSNSLGTASAVSLESVDSHSSTLGLVVSSGTSGQNEVAEVTGVIEGTIGGFSATSGNSGTILTGSSDASGLAISVSGGATGNRGQITFSRGLMGELDTLLNAYLSSDGTLEEKSKILTDRVSSIEREREDLQQRTTQLEERFLSQFTALDSLIAQLNTTSNFLTQQLANLPGATRTNQT